MPKHCSVLKREFPRKDTVAWELQSAKEALEEKIKQYSQLKQTVRLHDEEIRRVKSLLHQKDLEHNTLRTIASLALQQNQQLQLSCETQYHAAQYSDPATMKRQLRIARNRLKVLKQRQSSITILQVEVENLKHLQKEFYTFKRAQLCANCINWGSDIVTGHPFDLGFLISNSKKVWKV